MCAVLLCVRPSICLSVCPVYTELTMWNLLTRTRTDLAVAGKTIKYVLFGVVCGGCCHDNFWGNFEWSNSLTSKGMMCH